MKKIYQQSFAVFLTMAASFLFTTGCLEKINPGTEQENDKYDGPDQANEFEFNRTKDPATGTIPEGRLLTAMYQTQLSKNMALNSPSTITTLSWQERGPNSDVVGPSNGNTRANNGVTSGRIRAMMVDSADATHKTVWVGGVDGGLWKTSDITAAPATWLLVNDFLSNLAVAAISQDPTDPNIMYFCTGESYGNFEAVRGVGVFRSADHGVTWNYLASTSAYTRCTRILCDYQGNIYLATRSNGILRSTKASAGAAWQVITPSTSPNSDICDMEISSTSGPGRLHITTGIFSASAYFYTDVPSTVTSAAGWNTPTTAFTAFSNRTEICCKGNTLYALPCNGSYQVPTIWKSTDGGANWVATAGQPASGWASGQGWYSLSCDINPADPTQCIVGGLDTHKTIDGGATWVKISAWVGTGGQYVHADQHKVIWYDGGNKLLFACDGGVHYSSDGGTTIRDRNVGLRLKQFYSIAISPTVTDYFLAGAQDNGTHQLNNPGLSSSVEVTGGDGGIVAIDQDENQFQYGAYVYNQYRRSTNGGASWSSINFSSSAGQFINPFDLDNIGNIFYAGYSAGQYLRWNDPHTGSSTNIISIPSFNGASVLSVNVSPYTANRVYFGTSGGRVVQVDNANAAVPTDVNITGAGMTGSVSCVIQGTNDQNLMATYSNYGVNNVWVSTNGGTTWTAIDGNLPDMPVRWCLFYPGDNTKAYIATETGVWETDLINGASTVWNANPTFPNVRTDMIRYRASDRTIAAGTHGRGVWSAIIPASGCTPASIVTNPSNSTTCAGNNATFTVVANGTTPLGYQWQESINGGGTWGNITNGGVYSGATTTSLTLTSVTAPMNTYQYRCVVTGNCAPLTATSNAAILTVNSATTITSQPSNSTVCAPTATSFSVAATGSTLTYQWQVSTDGGASFNNVTNTAPYSGVTTTTISISPTAAGMNGYQYRCVVSSACSPLNSNAATLTVNSAPAISANPSNTSVCAGNAASFSVTASGGGLSYQWQESTNGGGSWSNLSNVAPYTGATSATLNINPTVIGMNNYQYRCIVTGTCPSAATSTAAILTVGTALTITSQPSNVTLCAGANTSFAVVISGTVISYQWQESINGGTTWNNITNGGVYSGAATGTLTLTGVLASMNNYQYRCVVTGACPAINSNAAILTVNTAPNITSQPTASTICATQNTGFTVAATGTAITYQWQQSTTGCAGSFVNLTNGGIYAGVTTAGLSLTAAPATMNGYAYRCVITGTCSPAATSACALLTVNTAVTISAQPSNSTICAGSNTSFSITAAGTSPAYQWQESTNGGTTWSNISNAGVYSGATTATLTLTGVPAGMNSYQYRCVVTGAAPCGILNSTAAILTVNTAPAITAQPVAGTTICAAQNTSYTVAANGTALTYQWQLSTDGGATYSNLTNTGVYTGTTTATISITGALASMNTYRYRCVISGTCSPAATSNAAILTVYTPISITTAPANATICATGTTSFSVVAAGTSPTYQWQESTNGGTTWNNISNAGIYSGATTTTLTLTGVTTAMNNNQYRTVVNGLAPCGIVNTAAAILTVSAQPTVTLTASPYTKLYPGYSTVITASVTPATGFTTVWTRNGTPITVTGNSKTVTVNELGLYTVVATIGSCTSVPASITISDSASSKLWIFPSPNDGQFTISYYNAGGAATTQNVTVYDSHGSRVYNNNFPVTQSYQLLKVDMRRNSAGVYYVVLRTAAGVKVKTGVVVIR